MDQKDRRGIAPHGFPKAVGQAHHDGVQTTVVDEARSKDPVLGVEQDGSELLLSEICQLGPQVVDDVGRSPNNSLFGHNLATINLVAEDKAREETQVSAGEIDQRGYF